jgi:TolB-like protein
LPQPVPRRIRVRYWIAAALVGAVVLILAIVQAAIRRPVNIAVARFDNETGLADMSTFADGLTDLVIADMTAAAGNRYGIIGNAAPLRRIGGVRDLRAIGAALNARYIVLGQVQRSGEHIRVLAHLIRLPEQTHLWVVRADRDITDPLRTESELGKLIASEFLKRLADPHAPALH